MLPDGLTADRVGATRNIVHRTRGAGHGPITRLISPEDLGEVLKPFVFLDLFEMEDVHGRGFAPHPHSGIATLTTFLTGSMTYADSTGKRGALADGAVEWMQAGCGVWHAGRPDAGKAMRGYQVWIALPPELELAAAESWYLAPDRIRRAGPARVLLGHYEEISSPISFPVPVTYLHVQLSDGQRWTYQPDPAHDLAWLAVNRGTLVTVSGSLERELAVFEEGNHAIELEAVGPVEFVIGSAAKHPYPLVNGNYSVHTSLAALSQGERNIDALRKSAAVAALRHG